MIYEPAFADQARHLCRLGATDEELAEHFGVCVRTIYRWRNAHEAFAEAVIAGKEHADARVERALYSRAVGCSVERTKVFKHAADPEPVYATYRLHLPPDPVAALQWLRVRQPKKWRIADEDKGDPNVVEMIQKSLARVANYTPAHMAAAHAGDPPGGGDSGGAPVPAPVYVKAHTRAPRHG
ncbi:MAG: helix-turn-helix domain-containing protein [Candidatus Sphingomonas phytovorans]|nr:helix-turn-helix domain-containing protein [Sphingomonas sp.]WEJ99450.1 MAG: helix-turn-helix domain-containing protein [Sphingomonas sp.]